MGISHSWNGTVLTITSDSGTSSCDLKGEKGDDGVRGAQGIPGERGSSVAADATLSVSGQAADAKVTGDKINDLQPIGQLVSGSTKPVTSGAAYTLQEKINKVDDKVFSELPKGTDFNSITTAGTYTVQTNVNSPVNSDTYHNVIVLPFNENPNYVSQLVVDMNDHNLYHRRRNNGNWGEWMRYVRKEELDALNTNLNKVNPSNSQLQSATDGTAGRVTMFTYGNGGYLDFDTNDAYSYRLVLGGNGLFIYKYENGTIIGSKEVAKF